MNTTHAFELLRRADPVSTIEQQRVAEHVARRFDDVISTVAQVAPERAQSRVRRRLVAVAAVVLVAALVAVPALGLGIPGIDFFGTEKAPPKAVELFESLSVGAPPGMDPQAVAGEARNLDTTTAAGHKRTVWVAPTRAGGLCYLWAVEGGGGCDKLGTTPLGVSWWSTEIPLIRTGRDGLALPPKPGDFSGVTVHASSRYVARVEIRFADGTVVEPPVTWVSEPIGHGFFLYRFTHAQRLSGHEVEAVVALDERGDVVTEEAVCCESMWAMPDDAIESEKRSALSIDTTSGPAVIWTAPTRYEGTCAWLEFEGVARSLSRCMPKGYGNDGVVLQLHPTEDTVLLFGPAADRYRQLDLRYAHGAVDRVRIVGRFFLVEIPREHLQERTRLLTVVFRDAQGREIPSGPGFTFAARGTAASPCFRVLPLAPGESCP